MQLTCPACSAEFPFEAGLIDADGKRLAALLAPMEPALGRAVLGYLRLFKPPKNALRAARAVKIVQQLVALVETGTVCRDERSGVRRPATPAMWAQAIESMIDGRAKLRLPLSGHGYLLEVAFSLADVADAVAERKREADRRAGNQRRGESAPIDPIREQIAYARQMRDYEQISPEQFEKIVQQLRAQDAARGDTRSGP